MTEAHATVLCYDDKKHKWMPSGGSPGLSFVQIIGRSSVGPYSVFGKKLDSHEVVLNLEVAKDWKYQQTSFTFHQWRYKQLVYGLSFMTPEEATEFGASMMRVLVGLVVADSPTNCTPPPPPQFCGPDQQLDLPPLPSPPITDPEQYPLMPSPPPILSSSISQGSSTPSVPPPPPPPLPPDFLSKGKNNDETQGSALAVALRAAKMRRQETVEVKPGNGQRRESSDCGMASLIDEMTATLARRKARAISRNKSMANGEEHDEDSGNEKVEQSNAQTNSKNICRRSKSACSRTDMELSEHSSLKRGTSIKHNNDSATKAKTLNRETSRSLCRFRRGTAPLNSTEPLKFVTFRHDLVHELHIELEKVKHQIVSALRSGMDLA